MYPKEEKRKLQKLQPKAPRTCADCMHRKACTMWVGVHRISCCDAVKCECFAKGECD